MKVLVSGYKGHMGQIVADLCSQGYRGAELYAGVDASADGTEAVSCAKTYAEAENGADIIIDFSHHAATRNLLDYAVETGTPLVLATTGQTDEERELIAEAAEKIPLFFASNYSLGVALLIELAKKTAAAMPDAEIEIIETHHHRKVDAPSGTAVSLANALKEVRGDVPLVYGRSGNCKRSSEEIGIHAVRMGNVVGIHEVIIGTENQTITLKHEAHSRALFAEGALAAAEFLIDKPAGLYTMQELVDA